ncbi:MAG TPA: O-methyltransferase [Caulobacteraceae bacterium]|jgi:predicted O-methyltransferase YrrM
MADQSLWNDVDRVFNQALVGEDPALEAALAASRAAGLPAIAVAPNQGKMLHLMARMVGASRILEVGTLGGYSAIWLARALAHGGRLISLEIDPKHAQVARASLAGAGLADRAEVRVGPALETLPVLAAEGLGPFDLVFIDADKPSNADYFAWALKLTRKGGLIVVDNVVRAGAVADAASRDASVLGVRRLLDLVAAEPRVSATAVQTVGDKGHDGFLMALVVG